MDTNIKNILLRLLEENESNDDVLEPGSNPLDPTEEEETEEEDDDSITDEEAASTLITSSSFNKLYKMAKEANYSYEKLVMENEVENNSVQFATELAAIIEKFRKENKQVVLANAKVHSLKDLLSGEDLIKNLAISLIRCKYYYWNGYIPYQRMGSTASKGKASSFSAIPGDFTRLKSGLYQKLFFPSNGDLRYFHQIYNSLPKNIQDILGSKPDLLTKFIDQQDIKLPEQFITKSICFLKEANRVPTSQNFENDSVSSVEDVKDSLETKYVNCILRLYVVATPANIPYIDERIYRRIFNPNDREKELNTRKQQATKRNIVPGFNMSIDAELEAEKEIPFKDEKESGNRERVFSDADVKQSEQSVKDNVIFSSNNFLHAYFSSMSYASCVSRLLMDWSAEPDNYKVKVFNVDRTNTKLVDVNLLKYLYDNSTDYLPTGNIRISNLQVDVLTCVSYLITLSGAEVPITEDITNHIEQIMYKIIRKYGLTDFLFMNKPAIEKQMAKIALGLSDEVVPDFINTTGRIAVTADKLFKDKLVTYTKLQINSLSKEKMEEILNNIQSSKTPIELLRNAEKYFDKKVISNLLVGSEDKQLYGGELEKNLTKAAKELVKSLNCIMRTDETGNRILTINNEKKDEKQLAADLKNFTLDELKAFLTTINNDQYAKGQFSAIKPNQKTALQKNIEVLIALKTPSSEINEEVDNSGQILQDAVIHAFVVSLLPVLQQIGIVLYKLGLFLIDFAKNPATYINIGQAKPDLIQGTLRSLAPPSVINKIMDKFNEIKDLPVEEFDPMLNPTFADNFKDMKSWLLSFFKGKTGLNFQKAIKSAEEGNWTLLKQLLEANMTAIKTKLGNSRLSKAMQGLIIGAQRINSPHEVPLVNVVDKPKTADEKESAEAERYMNADIDAVLKGEVPEEIINPAPEKPKRRTTVFKNFNVPKNDDGTVIHHNDPRLITN